MTIEDVKGKNVGVFSLASGGVLPLDAYPHANGMNLEEDINMIPFGYGPQASEALNRGEIDALLLWGAALNQLENMGHKFRYLRDEAWSKMPESKYRIWVSANSMK